uniref:Sxi1 n=1 Tax=Kwoniella heveanensis TaxID=89924 RepID=D1MBP1_9TREE|nr:Sxi1 [Kwoniella heveanensis]
MLRITHTDIVQQLLEIQPAIMGAMCSHGGDSGGGRDMTLEVKELNILIHDLTQMSQADVLDRTTATVAWAVGSNLKVLASDIVALQRKFDDSIDTLTHNIANLSIAGDFAKKRPSPSTPLRSSKRARRLSFPTPSTPPTRCPSPTPSLPDNLVTPSPYNAPFSKKSSSKHKHQEPDHSLIRIWFLHNISYPYPTVSMKEHLASKAGITRAKVDSDLTNFRRRAGWTEIMNEWCGGDRNKMRKLIERVESGKEDEDEELVRRVQAVKEYLTRKEEERVGDWVREDVWPVSLSIIRSSIRLLPYLTVPSPRRRVTALVPSFDLDAATTSLTSSSAKLTKHRSTASLSSLSAMSSVSAVIRPASRSTSTSSATSFESSSSVSDASMVIPGANGNKKRLNPDAAVFVPQKRTAMIASTASTAVSASTSASMSAFNSAYASASASASAASSSISGSVLAPSLTFTTISNDQPATHSRCASGSSPSTTAWQYHPTWTTSDGDSVNTFVHPGTPAPLPTPMQQSRSSPPRHAAVESTMWSTESPLPMLSHMSSSSVLAPVSSSGQVQQHPSWTMPTQCEFEPRLQDGWASASSSAGSSAVFNDRRTVSGVSGRSVSDVSRRL